MRRRRPLLPFELAPELASLHSTWLPGWNSLCWPLPKLSCACLTFCFIARACIATCCALCLSNIVPGMHSAWDAEQKPCTATCPALQRSAQEVHDKGEGGDRFGNGMRPAPINVDVVRQSEPHGHLQHFAPPLFAPPAHPPPHRLQAVPSPMAGVGFGRDDLYGEGLGADLISRQKVPHAPILKIQAETLHVF